jgi:hypothetical protein
MLSHHTDKSLIFPFCYLHNYIIYKQKRKLLASKKLTRSPRVTSAGVRSPCNYGKFSATSWKHPGLSEQYSSCSNTNACTRVSRTSHATRSRQIHSHRHHQSYKIGAQLCQQFASSLFFAQYSEADLRSYKSDTPHKEARNQPATPTQYPSFQC